MFLIFNFKLGMKFALIELKMAIVKLLLNYKIIPGAKFPTELCFREGIVRIPKEEINVIFEKRKNN
jgi:hypothetical protein